MSETIERAITDSLLLEYHRAKAVVNERQATLKRYDSLLSATSRVPLGRLWVDEDGNLRAKVHSRERRQPDKDIGLTPYPPASDLRQAVLDYHAAVQVLDALLKALAERGVTPGHLDTISGERYA